MIRMVLLRHGESIWNKENRFTGWTDVDLTEKGSLEAKNAGQLLKQNSFTFDIAFTSVLKRAVRSLWIVLDEMNLMWIPIINSWRLNERHYGALQGLNKEETAKKYGEKQVHIWRRSYDIRPPALEKSDERYIKNDPKYENLSEDDIPSAECLKDTLERFLPFWLAKIAPTLKKGKSAIISAHGNSLRALVKHIENITDKEIIRLNIPTGIPLVYELNEDLKPIRHYYLGNTEEIEKRMKFVEIKNIYYHK